MQEIDLELVNFSGDEKQEVFDILLNPGIFAISDKTWASEPAY